VHNLFEDVRDGMVILQVMLSTSHRILTVAILYTLSTLTTWTWPWT